MNGPRAERSRAAASMVRCAAGISVLVIFVCGGCQPAPRVISGGERPAEGRYAYLVAADHPAASSAGMEILARGGNAVDAAVAVSFVLAVVRPEDCGLGGGGFALYHPPPEPPQPQPIVLDFREEAPSRADLATYLDRDGRPVPDRTTVGPWAVGVPGQVRGALEFWKRFGSRRLSLRTVLGPAIALAQQGVPVDPHLYRAMGKLAERFRNQPEYRDRFGETYRVFLKPGGVPYEVGELLRRPDLARTLEAIALGGEDVFYRGEIAQEIVREIRRLGGTLSIAVTNAEREVEIRIGDTGCGLDERVLTRIFEPFYSTKRGNQERNLSRGLGLAVAHGILLGLHARGFAGMWRTGAPAYDPRVKAALGLRPEDHVVAFVYAGTPSLEAPPIERPKPADYVTVWEG